MPPEQVAAIRRNGWTACSGITGRHGPDYAITTGVLPWSLKSQVLKVNLEDTVCHFHSCLEIDVITPADHQPDDRGSSGNPVLHRSHVAGDLAKGLLAGFHVFQLDHDVPLLAPVPALSCCRSPMNFRKEVVESR